MLLHKHQDAQSGNLRSHCMEAVHCRCVGFSGFQARLSTHVCGLRSQGCANGAHNWDKELFGPPMFICVMLSTMSSVLQCTEAGALLQEKAHLCSGTGQMLCAKTA